MIGRKMLALAGGLLLWLPTKSSSKEPTGTVEGSVRATSGKPVTNATVTVDGTPLSVRSGGDGRFALGKVPAGKRVIRARAIGFAPEQREVEVTAGQVVQVELILKEVPFSLNELVVSAKTARAERRMLGNAIATLQANAAASPSFRRDMSFNTEEYKRIVDNVWQSADRRPLSTFSIDVDRASYTNVRRFISQGLLPPKDAVRIEEMINYFHYDYPDPLEDDPFAVVTELADAPWHRGHKLAMIGIQGRRMSMEQLPPNNLVFLLDVSGSMDEPAKLPLVKQAFRLLVGELRPIDRVAIVVYAGAAGLVLPSTSGDQKERILDAIERLEAGGSTAGGAGIQLAYQVARENLLTGGNNRVILATDGDFNVGPSSEGELVRMIEERRRDGVFLTVLGFGTGNLKDAKMVDLADKGNGHYGYVDNLLEARKVFVRELGATLLTIAKDVKIQVEFNPERVSSYRLVGYEKRLLNDEDFNDDAKDAGELGAGHSVTAIYEIVPRGVESDVAPRSVDPLKYQGSTRSTNGSNEWLTVKLRYKEPTGMRSKLVQQHAIAKESSSPSVDFRFAMAVAGAGMLLRDSEFKGDLTFDRVLSLARASRGDDEEGYRAEFIRLVEAVAGMTRNSR